MKLQILLALMLCSFFTTSAQDLEAIKVYYDTYEKYKEPSLKERRIKHSDLQPLIDTYRKKSGFTVRTVGESIEGRKLSLISIGSGSTDIFLWSQMHGDEPTATQAIFDILHFFESDDFKDQKATILQNVTVHFLPMLNPDGAEIFQRRNRLGIDINRDALRLQSPEGQTLKRVRDSLDADFGFNLHDQSTYYNAERTEKPATISYLAPAYNYEKEINEGRGNAMKLIVFMNRIIQHYAPGQVGRYNDDFEPRAFGDNIQKWGTSTILIESGGYPNDVEKQEIRKLNYVSILSAIYAIATKTYEDIPLNEYEQIPENDRKYFDLKINDITYELLGDTYILDVGIHRLEVDTDDHSDFWYSSRVIDMGDLSTYYGYETLDAKEYTLLPGKVYSKVLESPDDLNDLDIGALLQSGITYVRMKKIPAALLSSPVPIHLISPEYEIPEFNLKVGSNPTFILKKGKLIEYVVVNGFLLNPKEFNNSESSFRNAMIYR